MSQTKLDDVMLLEAGNFRTVYTVAFSTDGRQLFGGDGDAVLRFNIADGRVAKQTGLGVVAIAVSRDGKLVVCGTERGASVWDVELHEKVASVEDGTRGVRAVDVSPDSTRFATTTRQHTASVWDIVTSERLIGPIKFNGVVSSVRFSPSGDRLAACESDGPITILDSLTGQQLLNIDTKTSWGYISTRLAWTSDGKRLFHTCKDRKIKSYHASTGSLLAESQALDDEHLESIALVGNEKFIAATTGGSSISFLDASTLSRISPVIKHDEIIYSIASSPDGICLAAGRDNGKISIHNLTTILPGLAVKLSTGEAEQHGEQHPTLDSDKNPPRNSRSESSNNEDEEGPQSGDDDMDLLEVEIPTMAPPAPVFDYDEPLSCPSSIRPRAEELGPLQVEASHTVSQLAPPEPLTFHSEHHSEDHPGVIHPPKGDSVIRKWIKRIGERVGDQAVGSSTDPTSASDPAHAPSPPRNHPHYQRSTIAPLRHLQRCVAQPGQDGPTSFLFSIDRRLQPTQRGTAPHDDLARPPNAQDPAARYQYHLDLGSRLLSANDPSRSAIGSVPITTQHPVARRRDRVTFSVPAWLVCYQCGGIEEAA
ncbi:WD40-repeat-containing domain protein [Chiua virens]|nr:WD40-repeat-containing domain protein [Chiua virens]